MLTEPEKMESLELAALSRHELVMLIREHESTIQQLREERDKFIKIISRRK